MNLEHYKYSIYDNYFEYSFVSEGPRGKIKKIVRYTKIRDKPVVYNLGFGDKNSLTDVVNDDVISNNQDRDKVLVTVANTLIDFANHHGNHYVFATGSTPVRTRLYQMGISNLWGYISTDFNMYGLKNGKWDEFEKNINYDAFLVKRK